MPPRSKPRSSTKTGVRLWALETQGEVSCADFDANTHWAALGYEDGYVQLIDPNGRVSWEAQVGRALRQVKVLPVKKCVAALDEYSHLTGFDFSGRQLFRKDYDAVWTSFEIKNGFIYLWGWKSDTLKVDVTGRVRQRLTLPHPRRMVRAVPKKEQFWIVHNQICLGLYNTRGAGLWTVNCPAPIELSRDRPSEVAVSDSGNALAIGCFDKGVYIFDGEAQTLRHIDLDRTVGHIAVSGDGEYLLLSDYFKTVCMADREARVVWQIELDGNAALLRLDRKGDRVLILEENGVLSCHKFVKDTEARADYLELTSFSEVSDKKEIWKQKAPLALARSEPVLALSARGHHFLLGGGKDFSLYSAEGRTLWTKSFMAGMDRAVLSDSGDRTVFCNANEIFIVDTEGRDEHQVGFYHYPLKTVGIDLEGAAFMTFDASGWVAYYSGSARKRWSRNLNLDIRAIRLNHRLQRAVLHTAPSVLYLLNLKTLKAPRIRIGEAVRDFHLDDSGLYVGGAEGGCYRFDLDGNREWKFALEQTVARIESLPRYVAFRGERGAGFVFERLGYQPEPCRLHSGRAVLTQHQEDVLELVPVRDAVSCYKVFSNDLLWKIHLGATVKAVAACGANRMVVLDAKHFHYHQLVSDPAALEDRSSYLEF